MCCKNLEEQLEEQFLWKYLLVRPKNESDLGHTFSRYLIIKRCLKIFRQSVHKKDKKKKKLEWQLHNILQGEVSLNLELFLNISDLIRLLL